MKAYLLTATAALFIAASPAAAVTNLIVNGSFEDGSPGTGGFVGWTKSNMLIAGFGLVGTMMRRRQRQLLSA